MKALLLCIAICFSVHLSLGQTVQLSGTIAADTGAIDLGQLKVYSQADSSLIKGTYLDSSFFLVNLPAKQGDELYVSISIPGYLDTIRNIIVSGAQMDLGVIAPVKNTDLQTVDVVYRKETFKRTMDGISVSVDGTELQSLTNLFEVLKASPKIASPDDETIEIIGRGVPLILVDRQAIISNDELKAIPASQIDRIEIITNPSAKYKAQGSSNGVIEVYTKNFHLEGYSATISANGGINTQAMPKGSLNLGLSMKKKKFSLNGYLGAHYTESYNRSESTGETADQSRSMESTSNGLSSYLWQYYSLKGAYNISSKQRLSMGFNGYGSLGNSMNVSFLNYKENGDLLSESVDINDNEWKWLNNTAFVNYTVETDTNHSNFEINLNYINKISTNDRQNLSFFESAETGNERRFEVRNDSRDIPNVGELRVNYEHVFDTTGWKLSGGVTYSALFNNKRFDQYNRIDGEWVVDPDFSNSYDYQEHIGAAFVEVTKNWKKFAFRTGVRTEYTRLDGYSNSLNKQFMDSTYVIPFPSASVMYKPSDKTGITLFYDSGIDRPQFSNYDPFVRMEDSLSISYGNPFLRPAIHQTIGVDFDFLYAYNISLSYNFKRDPVSSISFIDEESFVRETTPWNAEADQGASLSISAPIQTKWLQGWNSIWVNYNRYTFTEEFQRQPFDNLTYGFYSYLTFNLPKNFNVSNRLNINKWGNSESRNNVVVNWGLRATKKYKGNNFQIFAEVENIIPPKRRMTTISGNYTNQMTSQNQFTTFKLGVYLKIGRLKAPTNIEGSESNQSGRL